MIATLITMSAYFALKKAIKDYFLLKCEFGDNIYKHNFFAYKFLTLVIIIMSVNLRRGCVYMPLFSERVLFIGV